MNLKSTKKGRSINVLKRLIERPFCSNAEIRLTSSGRATIGAKIKALEKSTKEAYISTLTE